MPKRVGNVSARRRRVRRKDHSQFLQPPRRDTDGSELAMHTDATAYISSSVHGAPISCDGPPGQECGQRPVDDNNSTPFDLRDSSLETPHPDLGIDVVECGDVVLFEDELFDGGITGEVNAPNGDVASYPSRKLKSTNALRMLSEGRTLAAVFSIIGTRRFSVWQYNVMRRRFNFQLRCDEPGSYPSYSKIQQNVFPLLRREVYVPSATVAMDVDLSKAGAPAAELGHSGKIALPRREIRYVVISSWGRLDLSGRTIGMQNSYGEQPCQVRQRDPAMFDSIEDAIVARMRLPILSSSVLSTTEKVGGFEIPTVRIDSGCELDVWLRPREPLTTLGEFLSRDAAERQELVLRRVSCRRTYLVTEESEVFDTGDVVTLLDWNDGMFRTSESARNIKIYLVHKMKKSEGIPRIHLAVTRKAGASVAVERVRCSHVRRGSQDMERGGLKPELIRTGGFSSSPSRSGTRCGVLTDGRRYVVYRVILFADDFDPFVGRRGSAGGLYLLPVGIPNQERTGVKGIRVLSMTPPGVSTGTALISLIPDIIEGTVKGFNIVDRNGEDVQMFVDVIGYQCDYFAVGEESDLRGHNSIAPCNHCTFERGNRQSRHNSMYAYSTSIHSANPAFRRDAVRMEAIRQEFQSDHELQSIGLRIMSRARRQSLPLHALHAALLEARTKVPRTIDGEPVVSASFDPYLSVVIAPDHLFANLIKNVVNANVKSLSKNAGKRACVHALIRDALRTHRLQTESQYIDERDGSLHVMSMAALFKVILVAPWAIAVASTMDASGNLDIQKYPGDEVVTLSFMLKDLIADTTFYARVYRDGCAVAKEFTPSGCKSRERKLTLQAMKYVQALDRCCGKSEAHAKDLDKPNVHRLPELYVHTIPTFGHVKQYQELSLERMHQPLKRALNNSNFKSAQLQVMDHVLADDWKGRIRAGTGGATKSEHLDESCVRKLEEVLTGGTYERSDKNLQIEDVRRIFDDAFLADINEFASVQSQVVDGRESSVKWAGTGEYVMDNTECNFADLKKSARDALHSDIFRFNLSRSVEIHPLSRACLITEVNGKISAPHREAYDDNIRRGDIVQAIVFVPQRSISQPQHQIFIGRLRAGYSESETALSSSDYAESRPTFWHVIDILEIKPPMNMAHFLCEVIAVVISVESTEGEDISGRQGCGKSFPTIYGAQSAPVTSAYILPLYPGVMKPMRLHACSGACNFDMTCCKLVHSERSDGSDRWLLYGSMEGFPPRSA